MSEFLVSTSVALGGCASGACTCRYRYGSADTDSATQEILIVACTHVLTDILFEYMCGPGFWSCIRRSTCRRHLRWCMLRNSQIGRDSCYTLQTTSSPHGPMHMLYMLYFKVTGTAIAKTMFAPDQPQGLDLLRNLWQYPLRYDDASCQSSGPARALNRRRDPVAAASSPGRPLARCVCPPLLPAPPGL